MMKNEWKPQPTEKAPELEEAITAMFGINRKEAIVNQVCPLCGSSVELDSFKNELSLKEFHISGMCQDCQDRMFA